MSVIKHPVFWGTAATILVAFFGIHLGQMQVCDEGSSCQIRFQALLSAPANEIEDALAGFAGTLAFIWIIVTVWIQSKELAAQREELKLTRQEFSRMADAQLKQIDLMTIQGAIFKDEQRERAEKSTDATILATLDQLHHQIQRSKLRDVHWPLEDPNLSDPHRGTKSLNLHAFFDKSDNLDERLFTQMDALARHSQRIMDACSQDEVFNKPARPSTLSEINSTIKKVSGLAQSASPAMKARLEKVGIFSTQSHLSALWQNDEFWQDPPQ